MFVVDVVVWFCVFFSVCVCFCENKKKQSMFLNLTTKINQLINDVLQIMTGQTNDERLLELSHGIGRQSAGRWVGCHNMVCDGGALLSKPPMCSALRLRKPCETSSGEYAFSAPRSAMRLSRSRRTASHNTMPHGLMIVRPPTAESLAKPITHTKVVVPLGEDLTPEA